jgi:C-terminal processing protease CtpA/Prc
MLSAARIRGIAVGGVRIEDPVVGLVLTRSAGIIEDGTLGAGFFRRFTATFDYSRRELRLVPTDRLNERQPFDASGLDFAYSANQDVVINGIATDSPGAAAGLMEGDRLLAIDDREAGALTIGQIKALLSRPGLACSIRVDRRGETRTAILHLTKRL